MHAALTAGAFEAGVGEHLADDETARFLGAHFAGDSGHGGQEANHQRSFTHHNRTPTDATGLQNPRPAFQAQRTVPGVRRQILNMVTRF